MQELIQEERRRHPRRGFKGPVTVVHDGRGASGKLIDLSVGGILLKTSLALEDDAEVIAYVPDLGRFDARVLRSKGQRVALSFVTDTQEQWVRLKALATSLR